MKCQATTYFHNLCPIFTDIARVLMYSFQDQLQPVLTGFLRFWSAVLAFWSFLGPVRFAVLPKKAIGPRPDQTLKHYLLMTGGWELLKPMFDISSCSKLLKLDKATMCFVVFSWSFRWCICHSWWSWQGRHTNTNLPSGFQRFSQSKYGIY